MAELTMIDRLTQIIQDEVFIIKDENSVGFSQLEKDTIQKDVNKLLDYIISQTEPRHIKVLIGEAEKKLMTKLMDAIKKENLERLKNE